MDWQSFAKAGTGVYICIMRLEEAIKSTRFRDEKHKVSVNLLYTTYWLKNQISKEMKSKGLTFEQFNIMRILKGSHPENMCIKDIADRMIEKNSNVPRIIDRLVIKKLVRRSTSKVDKRETLVTITEKGMEVLEEAGKLANHLTSEVIGLSEEDAQTLNELLEKLRHKEDNAVIDAL